MEAWTRRGRIRRAFGPDHTFLSALRCAALIQTPTKLKLLRQHWVNYKGRFGKVAALAEKEANLVEDAFYELECQEPLFREQKGWAGMPMHAMI